MNPTGIKTIDLHFQGKPQAIASYAIPHKNGVILVESGPGSTLNALTGGLNELGYGLGDVTDVLLTHIHLDHAGAAGALAAAGANIHVHPNGAKHMVDPSKLIASATRIYGERMQTLWGEMLPIPIEQVRMLEDGSVVEIGERQFSVMFTPGHAEHHACYFLDDVCFSGDVGAIRIPGYRYIRIPMPPPELDLEKWKTSIQMIHARGARQIAPTHFGIYDDADAHLSKTLTIIEEIQVWMNDHLSKSLDANLLKIEFNKLMTEQASREALTPEVVEAFALSNPLDMSIDGMIRYWKKVLHPELSELHTEKK